MWKLGEVRHTYLAQISLIKCYSMLQNARITAVTIFELLKKINKGVGRGGVNVPPAPPPRLELKAFE